MIMQRARRAGRVLATWARHPRRPPAHAEEGARTRGALRRLTYGNDTVSTVTEARRAFLREDHEASGSARVFLARVGRARARDLLALRRWDRIGRGGPIAPERIAARERFEALVEQEWGQPVALADLAVTGDDLLQAGLVEGPAVGEALRRLLAAVVQDPSLNTREALMALALGAPESID